MNYIVIAEFRSFLNRLCQINGSSVISADVRQMLFLAFLDGRDSLRKERRRGRKAK